MTASQRGVAKGKRVSDGIKYREAVQSNRGYVESKNMRSMISEEGSNLCNISHLSQRFFRFTQHITDV